MQKSTFTVLHLLILYHVQLHFSSHAQIKKEAEGGQGVQTPPLQNVNFFELHYQIIKNMPHPPPD